MKKTFLYGLLAALAAVSAASCTTEQEILVPQPSFPEDATLTMGFYAPATPATRAGETDMAVNPYIESMHVFFFDEDGTLLQVRKADLKSTVIENYNPSDINPGTMLSYWTVENVNMSVEKRILHFVANLDDETVPKSGSERSIFRSLSVAYPKASYWQRIELPGIEPYAYNGSATYSYIDEGGVLHENVSVPGTVLQEGGKNYYEDSHGIKVFEGDYITASGDKIVDGRGYYFVPGNDSPLREMIPLIRNFVQITFVNNWTSEQDSEYYFTLSKIGLVTTPKEGLVAPYNPNETTKFESAYSWNSDWTVGRIPTKAEIEDGSGYAPSLAPAGLNGDPVPAGLLTVSTTSATLFMYERGLPSEGEATSILIGGEVTGYLPDPIPHDEDNLTWFRLEITDAYGAYYPFYRNLTYELTLNKIVDPKTHGHASATEALTHVALGNISNAKETASLTQVNDGDGLTLWVDYVDYTTVGSDVSTTVPLIYTFFHNNGSNKEYYPQRVSFTQKQNTATGSNLEFATNGVTTIGKIAEDNPDTRDYWGKRPSSDVDWYLAMVTLKPQSSNVLQNDVEVVGQTQPSDENHGTVLGRRTLSRLVTYTVMQQQALGLSITKIGANEADRPTHLTVTLPNTLTRSAFPLALRIETEDNNLTPIDNVTAKVGHSTFDNSTRNAYYFVKTIDYDEYAALDTKAFTFDFKTTKATNRSGNLVTRVKVTEDKDAGEEHWFLSDDAHAVCNLECETGAAVEGIVLDKDVLWLTRTGESSTAYLTAHVQPWHASDVTYTIANSDPSVATVVEKNDRLLVTAVAYGTTTVTVTAHGDSQYSATCTVTVYEPVTSVTLDEQTLYLPMGGSGTLTATVTPSSGAGIHAGVTWSSSNTAVATVDEYGVVTAHAAGSAIITATAIDGSGLSDSCEVTVFIPVTGIALNKANTTIRHNWSEALTAILTPGNASNRVIHWTSSNTAVATVSDKGIVTVNAPSGTATITATSDDTTNGTLSAQCVVTAAPNPVTGLTLNKSTMTLDRWATETLTATVVPSAASDRSVVWSSDDPTVATVDANGVVTGVYSGNAGSATTTIRATAHDGSGFEATCVVTVNYTAVTGITLAESSATQMLPLGNSSTLTLHPTVTPADATDRSITWSSTDTAVATVDANGVVTPVSVGTVTITAATVDGDNNGYPDYTATCTVTVYRPVTSVSLNKSTATVYSRSPETLTATITPSGATLASTVWESNHPECATVTQSGVVSYVSSGQARITVTVTDVNGHSEEAYCDVTTTNQVTFNTNSVLYTANNQSRIAKIGANGEVQIVFDKDFSSRGDSYVELQNNTKLTVSGPNGAMITRIAIEYYSSSYTAGTDTAVNSGGGTYELSNVTGTWTGPSGGSSSVIINIVRHSWVANACIKSITVTYE